MLGRLYVRKVDGGMGINKGGGDSQRDSWQKGTDHTSAKHLASVAPVAVSSGGESSIEQAFTRRNFGENTGMGTDHDKYFTE